MRIYHFVKGEPTIVTEATPKTENPLTPCWTCLRNPYEHQGIEIARHTTDDFLKMYCFILVRKSSKNF